MALLACAVSLLAGRLAYASWLGTTASAARLHQAIDIWPHHGGFHRALAEVEPEREREHLARALRWRPRAAEPRIALSLIAENSGDSPAAHQFIDQAVALNRGFRPVWAKLNLLARRAGSFGREDQAFWSVARHAFAMSHRDRRALFELCWSVRPEGSFLVQEVIGRRPPVLFDAVAFFMNQHELAAAHAAFLLLLDQPYLSLGQTNAGQVATADERRQRGLDLCDLQLHLRDVTRAWQVWQGLGQKGLLAPPPTRCFGWRSAPDPTKGIEATPSGAAWQLRFTGDQPDQAPLLWRYLPPVEPGHYRVEWELDPPSSLVFPSELVVRPGTPARLDLAYRRQPGTVPLRAMVRVGDVRLIPLPEQRR